MVTYALLFAKENNSLSAEIGQIPGSENSLMRWEIPRLCRGGSKGLTHPGVCLFSQLASHCFATASKGGATGARIQRAPLKHSVFDRLRSGPFEGPATVKPLDIDQEAAYYFELTLRTANSELPSTDCQD